MAESGWQDAVAAVEAQIAALTLEIGSLQAQLATKPTIVATSQFLDQNGSISFITLYTPITESTFRVSCYISVAGTLSDTSVAVKLRWTDEHRPPISSFLLTNTGEVDNAVPTFTIHSTAAPIQFSTEYTGNTSNSHYDLYFVVEEI